MKHLKTYEYYGQEYDEDDTIDKESKYWLLPVGDWIIMTNWWAGKHLKDFIDTTPAQITDIKVNNNSTYDYVVKFDKPFLTDADPLNPGKKFRNVFEDGKNFTVGTMLSDRKSVV